MDKYNSDSDGLSEPGTSTYKSPPKKTKRLCTFRDDWKKSYQWLTKGDSEFYARCKLCNKDFSISHGGLSDVKQHDKGSEHKRRSTAGITSQVMSNFFTKQNTVEADNVTLAEVASTFHCVKHNSSYNAQDCANKLLPQILPDSNIAKKVCCGRTKSEAIVKEVLGHLAEKLVVDALKSTDNGTVHFSVMTDTSNKGNRKMYPICVQYFSFDRGCQTKLLDFVECSFETSDAISNNILQTLEKFDLNIENVTAFSADNTNANFGIHRSAYTLLKEKKPNLLKAGCLAHVLNNTFKFALNKLAFDVEGVVLKIFSHFQSSSLRREDLKEFIEYTELEWRELVKHVPTRWLSLGPAIERILKFFPALMSYFISKENDYSNALRDLLSLTGFETEDSINDLEYSKTSLYLSFSANVCSLFEKSNMILQRSDTTSTELFQIMNTLLTQLNTRIEENFFGSFIRKAKNHANEEVLQQAMSDFKIFYENARSYLESHFDFSDQNPFKSIACLSLNREMSFDELMEAVTALRINNNVAEDNLFDEYSLIKPSLPVVVKSEDFTVEQKWASLFSCVKNENQLPELRKVVSCALSIPPSNAYVERVFSQMSLKWTKTRNQCSVKLIRAELMISLNMDMTCSEFISKYKNDKKLLSAARNEKKYEWKNK